MKLILTQEVAGLGEVGDVVQVKDGYGRNYLVPRGLGVPWTRGQEQQVADQRRARERRVVADLDSARDLKARLEALRVRLSVRAGEGGRLFGAVTPADVVAAITAAGGPHVDRRRLEIPTAIKTVGSHTVTVRPNPDVVATVQVEVVRG